ncbi:MAG: hypothetical protein IPJ14_07800 [Kineosporiaceae bacterium]|nr:hypothetical protein [Kineosporiaceae bacterium]
MYDDWYEEAVGVGLEQGDIIQGCPVPSISEVAFPLPEELEVVVDDRRLIVLTQTCDLDNNKVDEVLLANLWDYDEYVGEVGERNPMVKSKKWRKAAVDGNLPSYVLLPPFEGAVSIGWSLVDFHHLQTLPKAYLSSFVVTTGARLRVRPPYKEHLAQGFARYMMRVGLPSGLEEFESVMPLA